MALEGGVGDLPWLFTGTFLVMLLAVPLYGWIVARFPRRRFVPLIYHFFAANLLIFFLLLGLEEIRVPVARAFYIWVSVFNLFVVSVFWSFMADLFRNEQGKRLFGLIAAGGSLGALLGPALTAALAVPLGPAKLLVVSALLLEIAVFCVFRLLRAVGPQTTKRQMEGEPERIGGSLIEGIPLIWRSPYLVAICLYILFFTTTSTFLYFEQAHLIAALFEDISERARIFALIDLLVAVLTLTIQIFVTGRVILRFGMAPSLAFLPVFTFLGFLCFALFPQLAVLVAFQSLRRAANFAVSKPAREVLFTVLPRAEKYKAKSVIDTLVYRGGDALSGWLFRGLEGLGLALPAIAAVTLPVIAFWAFLAVRLARRHDHLAIAQPLTVGSVS
jgi:AAA family ATP:ADP antiporter